MNSQSQRSTSRTGLLAGAAMVLLGAAGLSWWISGDPSVRANEPALAMRFDALGLQSYDVMLESRVQLDPNEPDVLVQTTRGALHLRVVETVDSRTTAECRFDPVEVALGPAVDQATSTELGSAVFTVEFEASGRIEAVRFPSSVSLRSASVGEEILRTFQVVVADHATSGWKTSERHRAGAFDASYESAEDREIRKRKLRYTDTDHDGDNVVHASLARAELSRDGNWLETLVLDEDVTIGVGTSTVVRARIHASLQRRSTSLVSADVLFERSGLAEGSAPADAVAATRAATAADRAKLASLIDEFAASEGPANALLHAIRDLLIECPELALELPDQVAVRDDRTGSTLVHALELAGNDSCQVALVTIADDGRQQPMNRLRAIIAAGGVGHASEDTIEALWRIQQDRSDAFAIDRANTAVLSLGRAAAGREDPAIRERLVAVVNSAFDDHTTATALQAIANSQDKSLVDHARSHLDASSPRVRAAAAEACATLADETDAERLRSRFVNESDAYVRAALTDGLARVAAGDVATCRVIDARILGERDERARGSMARYLADNLAVFPGAEATLRTLLETETHRSTRKYVAARLALPTNR